LYIRQIKLAFITPVNGQETNMAHFSSDMHLLFI
jgi:hypothetical protein